VDLIGKKFGRLTIMAIVSPSSDGRARCSCRCDCGNETTPYLKNVKSGVTQSCGCLRKERALAAVRTHGEAGPSTKTAEYVIWAAMLQRCVNPKNKRYESYGGRGIAVCERWRRYENFLADMGRRPDSKHSIERKDNDGPYSPDNCEWAVSAKQALNNRRNRLLSFRGETLPACVMARKYGIRPHTLLKRIDRSGWPLEKALTRSAA
jgi:hypothetical protein